MAVICDVSNVLIRVVTDPRSSTVTYNWLYGYCIPENRLHSFLSVYLPSVDAHYKITRRPGSARPRMNKFL